MDKHLNMEIAKRGLIYAIGWSFVVYIGLTMACQEISPFDKFLEMIVVVIGFFQCMYWIIIMVESTSWYDKARFEKDSLLAQEHVGAEPDQKDFENSP